MEGNQASWSITSLLSDVGDLVNGAIDLAASNKLIAVILGCSLVVTGYGVFTALRRKSKK